MTWTPTGQHLIAGEWVASTKNSLSTPWKGDGHAVSQGGEAEVDRATRAAEAVFADYSRAPDETRAAFLEAIAESIEARGAEITRVAHAETALAELRIEGERGRTTGQLRLFADHIRQGLHRGARRDVGDPKATPPQPELRVMQRPIGPVAVFGASNFPLAFSVAGGDTASALAVGCPVVVKGHEAHPATSELVAEAISEALYQTGLPQGVFSLLQGEGRVVGAELTKAPLIKAVGFTGSLGAGRALFDLCAARPEPIPFYGELGSVNPVFLLPGALAARNAQIAEDWVASLTMGAGQFCTNPGIVILHERFAKDFIKALQGSLGAVPAQPMLTNGIAAAFDEGATRATASAGVTTIRENCAADRSASPVVLQVSALNWIENENLREEVFGPLGIVVTVRDDSEMLEVARSFPGQLVGTLHLEDSDLEFGRKLLPILERMAGRVLANGFPTGVAVTNAMVHGGPWPASTNFGHTSVGTLAIRRWQRAVCWQDMPNSLM